VSKRLAILACMMIFAAACTPGSTAGSATSILPTIGSSSGPTATGAVTAVGTAPTSIMPTIASPAPATSAATEAASSDVIDAKVLAQAYVTDAKAADAIYKGKTLTVRGVVSNIKMQFGAPTILLRETENETGVGCWFPEGSTDTETMTVGQTVTVKGTLNQGDATLVTMQNCAVVK
jgi:hypothetical protein